MKKFIMSLFLAAVSITAIAGPVNESRARSVAEHFFAAGATRASAPQLTLVWNGLTRADSGDAPFYIYNNKSGGFVIISGDDAARTVLGYSRTGAFSLSGMPVQMADWLDEYKSQIALVRECDDPSDVRWPEDGDIQYAAVKFLNTATWAQSAPFNKKYPLIGGESPVTGCVATATAEVMYYHKWPKSGKGTLPAYSYTYESETITNPGHALGHEYQWDRMLPKYYGVSYTTAQADAVSTLMYDCSVMCKVSIKPGASSASTSNMPAAIVKYMDYDASATYSKRASFTTETWVQKLKTEIDMNRPVVYAGHGSGGHAFVVDGYDTEDNFHVNWGWSGTNNGYFAIDAFKPGTHDYTETQGAVFFLRPASSAGSAGQPYLYVGTATDGTGFIGISLSTTTFKKGVKFTADVAIANNSTTVALNGVFAYAHTDADGNIKEIISEEVKTTVSPGKFTRYMGVECTISQDIDFGDRIMCFYKDSGYLNWQPIIEDYRSKSPVTYVVIADDKTIEDTTTISYDKSTGDIRVAFKSGVSASLYRASDNSEVLAGWKLTGDVLTIHTFSLPRGEYKLNLSKNLESVDLLFEW